MPVLSITPIYAALIALLMAVLATMASVQRGRHNIVLGDGAISPLALAVRRFGNLAEYAAMAILLLAVMELSGVAPRWLHVYGTAFILLRLLHPFMLFDNPDAPLWQKAGRFIAAAGTAMLLAAAAIILLLG